MRIVNKYANNTHLPLLDSGTQGADESPPEDPLLWRANNAQVPSAHQTLIRSGVQRNLHGYTPSVQPQTRDRGPHKGYAMLPDPRPHLLGPVERAGLAIRSSRAPFGAITCGYGNYLLI